MTMLCDGDDDTIGPVLTRAEVRDLDRRAVEEFGMNSLVLMENAGRGATDVLCSLGIDGPVVICCGKGNNAGDGFVVARHLQLRGYAVRVLAWSTLEQLTPDAAANAKILQELGIAIAWFSNAETDTAAAQTLENACRGAAWIVDALLGTGATGSPRSPLDGVIRMVNASGAPIFALDVPSGLDCDTGEPADPTIRARHTCTFAALKPGLIVPAAAEFVGQVHVADIGVRPL